MSKYSLTLPGEISIANISFYGKGNGFTEGWLAEYSHPDYDTYTATNHLQYEE